MRKPLVLDKKKEAAQAFMQRPHSHTDKGGREALEALAKTKPKEPTSNNDEQAGG